MVVFTGFAGAWRTQLDDRVKRGLGGDVLSWPGKKGIRDGFGQVKLDLIIGCFIGCFSKKLLALSNARLVITKLASRVKP